MLLIMCSPVRMNLGTAGRRATIAPPVQNKPLCGPNASHTNFETLWSYELQYAICPNITPWTLDFFLDPSPKPWP